MTIKQGDAYDLPINLTINKSAITEEILEQIELIEFCFADFEPKIFSHEGDGAIKYLDGLFLYPITQTETFSLSPGRHTMDIRVLFNNSNVRGLTTQIDIKVVGAKSKQVLE